MNKIWHCIFMNLGQTWGKGEGGGGGGEPFLFSGLTRFVADLRLTIIAIPAITEDPISNTIHLLSHINPSPGDQGGHH